MLRGDELLKKLSRVLHFRYSFVTEVFYWRMLVAKYPSSSWAKTQA